MSISNITGGTTGNQKLGNMTVNFTKPITENVVSPSTDDEGYGHFNGTQLVSVASISGKYDDRFDDVGYYE